MEHKKFISKLHEGEYLDYLYSSPDTDKKLPLVFYIHGAGSRGNDLSLLEENSGLTEVIEHVGDKCIIAAPQCHGNFWFDLFEVLCEFVDTMRNAVAVDIDRVYITGASMGGYTTWQLCLSHPDWFAAAAPICGGGMYWSAPRLKDLPIWAFHGALDTTVLPEETIHMVSSVNRNGGNAKITIFPKADHNAWVPALSMDETWEWIFEQKRTDINEF
jgi:phospholipase/carboxylesterase